MIVRRARPADAGGIAAVHVAVWRSAYADILPPEYLAQLSVPRLAQFYGHAIHGGGGVFVATTPSVAGFATAGRARARLADGEIETLYVLDDWRDRGLGRRLLTTAGAWLQSRGANSAFLWVLRDNPSRWFYERLGGRPAQTALTSVAGRPVPQIAYVWDPIDRLLADQRQRS